MIRQFVPQGVCLKCLGCCRFKEQDSLWLPYLLDTEIQDLLDREIPSTSISFLEKKIRSLPNPTNEGFICAFFDVYNNRCKIYDFRPFQCQLYPFLINLKGQKVILTVDLNCPYIKEKAETKEFKEYTDYLADFLDSPAQIRLLKSNPQLLATYAGVWEVLELNISDEIK